MLLYFIPEAKALSAELLDRHGLGHLGGRTIARETYQGPRGQGLLVAGNDCSAELLRYDADAQTWSERYGLDCLVGTWHDHPVTPDQLARETLIPGPRLPLLDGHQWQIPLLRQWRPGDEIATDSPACQYSCQLPRVVQQSPVDGRLILGAVVPQYAELWARSMDYAAAILQQLLGQPAEIDDQSLNQFAIDLLAVNYRVDTSIVSHLRLLTPELLGRIISAALDMETLRAHLKNLLSRRTSGGTNSASGKPPQPEASTTPTAPRRRK